MKNMKNKKVLITVIFSVVCAIVILAVLLIGHYAKSNDSTATIDPGAVQSFGSLEEAVEWAGFSLQCSDRLDGILVTDYSADQIAITVTYGKAGYISKALILEDTEISESTESVGENRTAYEINDLTVWFTGEENAVSKAEWIDNGFAYTICLTNQTVAANVMTDYVLSTR